MIAIPVAMAAGIAAGAFWGFIPGILKAVSGAHEVVTTIMLNYVAIGILAWAVSGPLEVVGSPVADHPERRKRGPSDRHRGHRAPRDHHRVRHDRRGKWLLVRTTLGFEIRTVGANPDAARYAGMRPGR